MVLFCSFVRRRSKFWGKRAAGECRTLAVEGHYYSLVEISIPAAVTGPERGMSFTSTVLCEGKKKGNFCRGLRGGGTVHDFDVIEVPLYRCRILRYHSKSRWSNIPNSPFWGDGGKIKSKNTWGGGGGLSHEAIHLQVRRSLYAIIPSY